MRDPPLILVVDDTPANVDVLTMRLESQGYGVEAASDGQEGLDRILASEPDLVLLDVMMPKLDGLEVCRRVRAHASLPYIPIVMVTAKADRNDIVAGLDAGADDYLTKPVDQVELMARVRSMLRIKALQDTVREQAEMLVELNGSLEQRVHEQVAEIGRMSELRRFLAPQIADLVVADGDLSRLASHRREIVVLFCDLRGFTAFAETAEPEDLMRVLEEYHRAIGERCMRYEATLERFAGDSVMMFFNDPQPVPDPALRAIRLAEDLRCVVGELCHEWKSRGFALGLGVGIAQGYATIGRIGFDGRYDYAAIGTVTNTAARLCAKAGDGQILVTRKVAAAVEGQARFEAPVEHSLKGLSRPIAAYNLIDVSAGEPPQS